MASHERSGSRLKSIVRTWLSAPNALVLSGLVACGGGDICSRRSNLPTYQLELAEGGFSAAALRCVPTTCYKDIYACEGALKSSCSASDKDALSAKLDCLEQVQPCASVGPESYDGALIACSRRTASSKPSPGCSAALTAVGGGANAGCF